MYLQATVTVNIQNRSPVANDDQVTATAGKPVTINPLTNDSDPDGDPLTITAYTQGRIGSVSKNSSGRLVYSAPSGVHGTDRFTYTISDGHGHTATAAITVAVTELSSD
jgi:hypothetical protein